MTWTRRSSWQSPTSHTSPLEEAAEAVRLLAALIRAVPLRRPDSTFDASARSLNGVHYWNSVANDTSLFAAASLSGSSSSPSMPSALARRAVRRNAPGPLRLVESTVTSTRAILTTYATSER